MPEPDPDRETDVPPAPVPADLPRGDRYTYRFRLFAEVVTADGHPFFEGQYQTTLFNHPRVGVIGMNQATADLVQAHANLGVQAAQDHMARVAAASAPRSGDVPAEQSPQPSNPPDDRA